MSDSYVVQPKKKSEQYEVVLYSPTFGLKHIHDVQTEEEGFRFINYLNGGTGAPFS